MSQEAQDVQDGRRGTAGRGLADSGAVRFGSFELDFATGELRKAGVLVHLQQQPYKVLALLAGRAGQLITREEIQREVWRGDTYVDFDQGLNFCIKQIRVALGDQADTPRYVETLPRRGYRFVAPVTPVRAESGQATPLERAGATTAGAALRRLHPAILPALALVALAIAAGLWMMHPEAIPPSWQRLTFRRGNVLAARFAPGGEILYTAAWGGEPSAFYAGSLGSPDARRLTIATGRIVAVSAQGEVAYIDSQRRADSATLVRTPLAGGPDKEILKDVFSADWSADGGAFAVTRSDHGMAVEYPIGRRIGRFNNPRDLRISPDGTHLALIEHPLLTDDRGSVVIFDRNGKIVASGSDWGTAEGLAWSARGDEVYFTAARSGVSSALWAIDFHGKERLVLPASGRLVIHDVAPDGRLLVERTSLGQEARFGREGAEEKDLSWFDLSWVEDLTSDGKNVLLLESGEAGGPDYGVYLRPTDGSPAVRLGSGRATAISPDGRFVLAIPVGKLDHIDLLPVGAGETRALRYDGIAVYEWAGFFPDGERILFAGQELGHPPRVWQGARSGGKPRPVGPEGLTVIRNNLSPDGRFLAMRCAVDASSVCLFPVDGGEPRPLPDAGNVAPLGWDASGRWLYIREHGRTAPASVARLEVATGRREPWRNLAPPDPVGLASIDSVVIARDGRSYAYSYSRRLSELYVVTGAR